jgi:SSS family solute:Na+ symporter
LDWVPEFSPVNRDNDLSVQVWVKHDRERLHFAFSVTDDRIYGVDTPRWLPPENPRAHDLTREGFPWFGDEVEILINARNRWIGNESAEGNGGA